MPFKTLISTDDLAAHLADPSFAIVDCRAKLDDPGWGPQEYETAHIPGAVFAHLSRDLAGVKTGANGRHPLPDPAAFMGTLSRLGIDSSVQVVAYDQDVGMFACRLWWMLRWLGHHRVAVLDGGFTKWAAEGRPAAPGVETGVPRSFVGAPNSEATVSAGDLAVADRKLALRIVDARAPERFAGEVEPIDRVGGHIPGATNHFFRANIDERGVFKPADTLRHQFHSALGDTPPSDIVCYCGSGVTACHNLLALEHAGLSGARLYPGSWSEWSSDPRRPVATGPELKGGDGRRQEHG